MKSPTLLVIFAGLCAAQTTVNGGRDYKGKLSVSGTVSAVDFSGAENTAPVKTGLLTARPVACNSGQIYFATNAVAGQNLYFCTSTGSPGTWSQMGSAAASATTTGSGAPGGNCTPPAMYIDTASQNLWFCGAANSWKMPAPDTNNVATLTGGNVWTGYNNLSSAQWRPPESSVANLPAAAGNTGKVFMVTDAASAGSCSTGGGAVRELCRASANSYECVGGCGSSGSGGGGSAPYISPLIAGPDTVKTISGATHGFGTTALLVAVYDNATPRNAISAGWTVSASTYDVAITFAAPQPNYYVVINGGVGMQGSEGVPGPAGLTGPAGTNGTVGTNGAAGANGEAGPSGGPGPQGPQGPTGATGASGSGTGTINTGTTGQIATYTGTGTTVGAIGPGTTAQVLHGNAAGQPSYGLVVTADVAANAIGSGQMAAGNARRTCMIVIGADNGPALSPADIAPQGRQCFVPAAAHIVEIAVAADAGTPAVMIAKNHAGSLTDLSASLGTAASGGLACANATGSGMGIDGATACTALITTIALAAGDWIETHTSGSASTAKRMSISITYMVD